MSQVWYVLLTNGHQLGPVSTEEILQKIDEGIFQGEEKIKDSLEGRWRLISKEPKFYDRLLQSIERRPSVRRQEVDEKDDPTQILQSKVPPEKEPTVVLEVEAPPKTINLQNLTAVQRQEKKKSAILPLSILAAALVAGAAAVFWPTPNDSDKLRLVRPKIGSVSQINEANQKEIFTKAFNNFISDQYAGFTDAQNQLINLAEAAPQFKEGFGFLCLVYKELWPFARQDGTDLETLQVVMRHLRSIDPVGINSHYCEVSRLMVLGKYKDARGIVDYVLNQPQQAGSPVLYSIKAEVLASERDYKAASLYAEKAADLWPNWVRPRYQQAIYLSESNQTQAAVAAFDSALKINPRHRPSLIGYGALLFEKYNRVDQALTLLSAALASGALVTQLEEARNHYLLAKIHDVQGNSRAALDHAEKAFRLNPGDHRLKNYFMELGGSPDSSRSKSSTTELVFLGDQYARAGDCLSAQAEYKAAFDLDSKNAFAASKAAKCLWKLNQSQEAITWLEKAIVADKKFAQAYYLIADYNSQRFNFVAATEMLNRGARVLGQNYEILRGYGLVEYRRNNFKDAASFLEKSLKIYPNDVEGLVIMSKAQIGLGDYQKAQNNALKAVELDGTNNEALIVYAKAISQFQGVDAGIFYIKDLISRFSYTLEFRLALAEIYRDVERYAQAQEIFERIVDVDARNKKALMGLGDCQLAQGMYREALKTFLSAGVLDPSDAEPLFKAGQVYLDSNKYAEAITQFQRALRINPYFPRANFHIGRAAYLSGNYQLALQAAADERRTNPGLVDSYLLAAEVYAASRDYSKCATEYQQAIKLRPQGASLYVKLARCHRLAGSADIAESMLSIAAGQESGLADIYKEQGALFEQKGDLRAAAQAYDKYLALSPNAPDRAEVESRLSNLGQ